MGDWDSAYKDAIPYIDFKRDVGDVVFQDFKGLDEQAVQEFSSDIEQENDAIELHLARTKAYKEMLILTLARGSAEVWKPLMKAEQKTFGGSKIFYLNPDCSRILLFAVKGEIMSKLNMLVTRLNKVNERITRKNAQIKKENLELYDTLLKRKTELSKKDEVMYFINQNLRT